MFFVATERTLFHTREYHAIYEKKKFNKKEIIKAERAESGLKLPSKQHMYFTI